jgi:hypothetical protein
MPTRQAASDQSPNLVPTDHRAADRAGAGRRAVSSKSASVRGVLVAVATLWALVGVAVTTQSAGATPVRSRTVLVGPLGRASQSARSTLPTKVSASIIEAIVKRPCTLLTEPEADAAARARFSQEYDLPKNGLCEYVSNSSSNATINIYVQVGTVAADMPPKFDNTFIPEPSLGKGVVWVVEKGSQKGSGELWFPLGKVHSESYSVQVELGQGGLPEASTIAQYCFTHM